MKHFDGLSIIRSYSLNWAGEIHAALNSIRCSEILYKLNQVRSAPCNRLFMPSAQQKRAVDIDRTLKLQVFSFRRLHLRTEKEYYLHLPLRCLPKCRKLIFRAGNRCRSRSTLEVFLFSTYLYNFFPSLQHPSQHLDFVSFVNAVFIIDYHLTLTIIDIHHQPLSVGHRRWNLLLLHTPVK